MRLSARLGAAFLVVLITACAASPRERLSTKVRQYGMQETQRQSTQFEHLVIRNSSVGRTRHLNVYLEGDGKPWLFRVFHSKDPTPSVPLMLALMSADTTTSIYLGRPCYNEHKRSANCSSRYWTSGRYSTPVVESMTSVLLDEIERLGVSSVSLFGHSGGGALALLLAERMIKVKQVVTLGGNIDTDAWTAHHGYSRLYTSLNPARRNPLPERIEQVHFVGENDANIPPTLVRSWVAEQSNSYGVLLEGFDHGCCWSSIWRTVLQSLSKGPPYQFPGKMFKTPEQIELN